MKLKRINLNLYQMINYKIIALSILGAIVLFSCSQHKENNTETRSTKATSAKRNTAQENIISIQKTTPDKTVIWPANPETTQGIKKMRNLLTSFSDKENSRAYKRLKGKLELEFMTILTSCTMQGEAHNQLHDYLIPIKDSFKGLASDNLEVCKKSFTTIKKQLDAYGNYFE